MGFSDRIFLSHPRTAGQGYFEHLRFAWSFGIVLLRGAFEAFVHGVVPCVMTTNASSRVRELYRRIEGRDPVETVTPS
jgi:uncharacterized circularly permuted ATP-grasp superfamily protein